MTETENQEAAGPRTPALMLVLGLAIVLPNAWTSVTITRTRALWTTSIVYVTSLAVTDMMVGFSLAAYNVLILLGYDAWLAENKLACLGYVFITFLSVVASIMSYTVISIDRYVYISRPYFYQRAITPRRVVGSVLTMWGAATGLAVVMCALKNADENVVCSRSTASKTDAYIVGPVYFTCSAVSGIMYALISRIALQQLKRTGPSQTPTAGTAEGPPVQEALRRRLRAVKMFVVVFGVFLICYTPYVVINAMQRLTPVPVPNNVNNACLMLVLLNSLLNVPIYLALNAEFRVAFTRLCRRGQVESRQGSSMELASWTISGRRT